MYEHLTPEYALEPNEPKRRIVVALLDNDKKFIDSFDYKQLSNQIRFYGESKHYNWKYVKKFLHLSEYFILKAYRIFRILALF